MALVGDLWEWDDRQADAFFAYAGYKARNPAEPLRAAGSRLLTHINRTFQAEGAYDGADPWEPLNADYAMEKLAKFGVRPVLVASGKMRREAISRRRIKVSNDADGGTLNYELHNPVFAEFHQDGATQTAYNHRGEPYQITLPSRPFVRITPQLSEQIEFEFRLWLEQIKSRNRRRASLNLPNPLD